MAAGYPGLVGHHRHLLDDRVRTRALLRALARVVRPGDVVADLGTGTGILAMAARRAGARAVYAIERDPIIQVAAEVARRNGVDGITFLAQHSRDVRLPAPVDVIVSECFGPLAVGGTMLRAVVELRDRHLVPGGRVIPRAVRVVIAPVEAPDVHAHVTAFGRRYGFDWSAARQLATHNLYNTTFAPRALLAPGAIVHELALDRDPWTGSVAAEVELVARRAGAVHGFAAWFTADLGGGVTLDTGPGRPATIWRQVFLPLPRAIRVAARAPIRCELRCHAGEHFDWRGAIGRARFACSTRYSYPEAVTASPRRGRRAGSSARASR